jgi:hypothetical protein
MIVMEKNITTSFPQYINHYVIATHMLLVTGFRGCLYDEKILAILLVVYYVSLVKIFDLQIITHYS